MPVKKYRSVADMPPVPPPETLEELWKRITALWARSWALSPMIYPKGVFKFRSIEEAQAARERVTQENVDRIARERQARPGA
jgi:hypothetical protein